MEGILQKFKYPKFQLEEIISATNNFNEQDNLIGVGGFGRVYRGEVSHYGGRSMVAIKRLDRGHGQGEAEFLKEIDTLSRYRHQNLIALRGFCYQGEEAILVYEYASNGSLDRHLNSIHLTWSQRINICLGAARGISHLHDPKETHQRLIHCDVKGGNILLDDNWNAKVADFGFSVMGPANELQSTVITLAAGTKGYIDPLYQMTHTLTKESDVYSFGVVLVEVLCGSLCYTCINDSFQYNLVPTWIKSYQEKKLEDVIFKDPAIQPFDQSVLEILSNITYQCLNKSRENRPKMAHVVTELERAFNIQELVENPEFKDTWDAQSSYYKEMAKTAETPLKSKPEFMKLLSKGVLLNKGKTWFSLNKKGEHCEMISIAECLGSQFKEGSMEYNSRFHVGTYDTKSGIFEARVKSQFLSPGITYTVNLVFKFCGKKKARRCERISLKYRLDVACEREDGWRLADLFQSLKNKLQGETESSIAYLAYEIEDGWWMCELYQFTCDNRIVDLNIVFDGHHNTIQVEGIEFRPLEKVEQKEDEKQPVSNSDSDANWEEKLPTDYEDIMKRSTDRLQWTTEQEAYSAMRKGFFINDNYYGRNIWFSLDINGKKCIMLSAEVVGIHEKTLPLPPLPESRFGEVFQYDQDCFFPKHNIWPKLLSSKASYAIYLVYILSKDQSGFEAPMLVEDRKYLGSRDDNGWYIYLVSPQTPVFKPKAGQSTHNPAGKLIKESLPQIRKDGWMEVKLLEFQSDTTFICMDLYLRTIGDFTRKTFRGLIIEGFEIRPV